MDTREQEAALAITAKDTKEFNAKIDDLIAAKKEDGLKAMSIEDLVKLRK